MPTVTLRCFPEADARFRRDALDTLRATGVANERALETALRHWYPACVVRVQADLAAFSEGRLWYAFRDGEGRPAFPRSERLYEAMGRSRDLIASTLAAVDRAAESPAANRPRVRRAAAAFHDRFDGSATGAGEPTGAGR